MHEAAQTALVTGASGFLGSGLCHALHLYGVLVVPIAVGERNTPASIRCEMLCRRLASAFAARPVSVVFHLAGAGVSQAEGLPPRYHYDSNLGTAQALASAIEASDFGGRVVFASSASVYGNTGSRKVVETDPLNPCTDHGRAKAEAEQFLLARVSPRAELVVARLFPVFGPGQRKLVVYDLASRIVAGELPLEVLGTGTDVRDFVFVDDALRALLRLGVGPLPAGLPFIVNICSGQSTAIGDLARTLLRLAGHSEHELYFVQGASTSPVADCIGHPRRLADLGIVVPPMSAVSLQETLMWIRGLGRQ